ncbi:hypothetical protein TWF173_001166 [Orbilia oligospora]|nr:hypothetical protein TWF173_001166 [Orbilia oligospora]
MSGTQWSFEPLEKIPPLPLEKRRNSIGNALKKGIKKVAAKIHQVGQPKSPPPCKRQRSSFIPPHLLEDEAFDFWSGNSITDTEINPRPDDLISSINLLDGNINLAFHTWRNPIPILEVISHASVTTLIHLFHTAKVFRLIVVDMFYAKYFRKFYKQWRYPKLEDLQDIALQLKKWATEATPEVTELRILGWLQMLLFHVSSYLVALTVGTGYLDGSNPAARDQARASSSGYENEYSRRWDNKLASCPTSYFKMNFQIFPREHWHLKDSEPYSTVEDIDFDFGFEKTD